MAAYEFSHDILNAHVTICKNAQDSVVRSILLENGGSIGGLIGSVTGANGHYDLESIFFDKDCKYIKPDENDNNAIPVVCHLNYPAFEVDVDFYWLSFDERQQIVELLIKEMQNHE